MTSEEHTAAKRVHNGIRQHRIWCKYLFQPTLESQREEASGWKSQSVSQRAGGESILG